MPLNGVKNVVLVSPDYPLHNTPCKKEKKKPLISYR